MNWLSNNLAKRRLGVSDPVFRALVRSGLLGYGSASGMASDQAVLAYQRYGTQWRIYERLGPRMRMMEHQAYENLPPIEGIGPQPPSTRTRMSVAASDKAGSHALRTSDKTDTGWIAHFYLVANYFYFPNPSDLTPVWPPPLELPEPRRITGADLPVTLYPHPSGFLGLVVVEGLDRPLKLAHKEAYDVAIPLLDELSARYDVPLPVVHSMEVGVPSGVIHVHFPHRPKAKKIAADAEILPSCPHPELRDAYALYRDAVSSNNPFHAFLTFWKVHEEAVYVRQGRGARLRCADTRVRPEVFPDHFAFGARPEEIVDPTEEDIACMERPEEQFRNQKFDKAKEMLRGPFRAALAHAGEVDAGKTLSGAYFEDYDKVATKVQVVRYMANVTLENVRATFDADAERQGAGT